MNADSFACLLDILRNEKPTYGNASMGLVTTQGKEVGEVDTSSPRRGVTRDRWR